MVGQLLLNLLQGDPLQQAFQQGAAPTPGPQGGPPAANVVLGAPSGPPGAPGPPAAPLLAPAQATQSPPDLTRLYLQLLQRNRAADEIDRGLTNVVAAFSPPAAQASVMANMPRGTDTGAELSNLMQLQQYGMQQQAMMQMLAPDAVAATAQRYGLSVPEVRTMIMSGKMPDLIERAAGLTGPPITQERMQAIAQFRAQHPGQPLPPELATDLTYEGAKTEQGKQLAQIGEDKTNAVESFPALDKTYSTLEDRLKWLNDPTHKDAVVNAIQKPEMLTTGQAGRLAGGIGLAGVDQDTLTAKSYLDQVKDELFSANFTGTKNVRNLTEANKLQGSASNLFRPTNDPQTIQDELNRLTKETMKSHATIMATAGKQIPYQYKGMADSTYLDPNSKYYNGATEQEPPKQEEAVPQGVGAKPLDDTAKAKAQDMIKQYGRDAVIKHLTDNGYDTSGL